MITANEPNAANSPNLKSVSMSPSHHNEQLTSKITITYTWLNKYDMTIYKNQCLYHRL